MSKIEFLDPKEAEKFKKQKWNVFCWTPCITVLSLALAGTVVPATFVVTVVPTNVVGSPVLRILPLRLANLITKPCQNFLGVQGQKLRTLTYQRTK